MFPRSLSSSEDDLPAHHSSEEVISFDEWMLSDYNPPWSSDKEDLEDEHEEDEDDADADDDSDSDSDSDSDALTLTLTRLLPSQRGEHDPLRERIIFRLSSL